jgi:hypothetical protein
LDNVITISCGPALLLLLLSKLTSSLIEWDEKPHSMLSPSASDDEMDDLERVRIEGAMIDAFVVNILVGMLWMLWR